MFREEEDDLFKAIHKYIKRTGSPGAYKYWYKAADGRLVTGAEAEREIGVTQEHGKVEHAKRLAIAKKLGKTNLSRTKIAERVGLPKSKVHTHNWGQGDHGRHGIEDHQMNESIHEHVVLGGFHSDDYKAHLRAHSPEHVEVPYHGMPAPARTEPESPTPEPTPAPAPTPEPASEDTGRRRRRPIWASNDRSPAPAPTPPISHEDAAAAMAASDPVKKRQKELLSKLKELNPSLYSEWADESEDAAREAIEALSPANIEAARADLVEADHDFAASEAETEVMISEQSSGDNPYLKRAKEIFEKVKGSLNPERRETIGHIFSTIENYPQILGTSGEQAFIAKYNEISGRRVRSIKGLDADLDPGVAFTVKEIVHNYPVDPEIERAKRGYTSKQIARISPYLKKSFKDQNPNGFPPPFPTFGDLEKWSERKERTGEARPSWASPRSQISIPKEIFDALPKSQDGSAKLPPRNFPVHLMPVWNYVAKKEVSPSALYSGSDPGVVVVRAIKKYVEKRGGGLVDIPTRKLDEVALTHADIFKAEMTDDQAWKWAAENYIDPVRLLAIVKNLKPETKKSISLVVGTNDTYTPYESIRKSMDVIKIQKLKEILIARKNK